jgi:hypothetical protein
MGASLIAVNIAVFWSTSSDLSEGENHPQVNSSYTSVRHYSNCSFKGKSCPQPADSKHFYRGESDRWIWYGGKFIQYINCCKYWLICGAMNWTNQLHYCAKLTIKGRLHCVGVTPEMHFVPKHVSERRNAFRDLKSPNTSRDVRNAFRDDHRHEMHFVMITPTPKWKSPPKHISWSRNAYGGVLNGFSFCPTRWCVSECISWRPWMHFVITKCIWRRHEMQSNKISREYKRLNHVKWIEAIK